MQRFLEPRRVCRELQQFPSRTRPGIVALLFMKISGILKYSFFLYLLTASSAFAAVNVERQITALDHPLWTARRDAADNLASAGKDGAAAVPKLVVLLADVEKEVRRASVRALEATGDGSAEAVNGLVGALQDSDWVVRRSAALALATLRTTAIAAIPEIRKLLTVESVDIRNAALLALAGLAPDSKQALPDFIKALSDPDWKIRSEAAHALGNLGNDASEAVNQLAINLRDPDWRVAEQVVEALSRIGVPALPVLIEGLKATSVPVRWGSARALGTMGAGAIEAVPALAAALGDQVMQVQWASARALWAIGEQTDHQTDAGTIQLMIQAMSDEDWVVRWAVARALGVIGDPSAATIVGALATGLADKDSRVCEAASFALEQMGPAAHEAIPALAIAATLTGTPGSEACTVIDAVGEASEKLVIGTGWTVRWTATRALGVVGSDSETSVAPLMVALKDAEWQVRGIAALALGQHRHQVPPEVVTALSDSLKDDQAGVRMAAAIALGQLGPSATAALPTLQEATTDTEQRVREAVDAAIVKISGKG
jgi:HEAT repeat protein